MNSLRKIMSTIQSIMFWVFVCCRFCEHHMTKCSADTDDIPLLRKLLSNPWYEVIVLPSVIFKHPTIIQIWCPLKSLGMTMSSCPTTTTTTNTNHQGPIFLGRDLLGSPSIFPIASRFLITRTCEPGIGIFLLSWLAEKHRVSRRFRHSRHCLKVG